ncbi:hypothetical protein FS837_007300, partial [Tulasnella sp. UAMH 9824]
RYAPSKVLTNYEPYHTAVGEVSVIKSLVLGKCPGSLDMISALAPDNNTACQRVLDSLKCIITECWAADPERRPPSSEIMNRVFFQSDAQRPDAPSAPSEPPSIESVVTVGFVRTDYESGEDQNTGRVALPTES